MGAKVSGLCSGIAINMPSTLNIQHRLTLRAWFRLLAIGLLIIVLGGVARLASIGWQQHQRAERALLAVEDLRVVLVAAEMVSRERGPTNAVLGDLSVPSDPALRERLRAARERTDAAFAHHLLLMQREQRVAPSPWRQRAKGEAQALAAALRLARNRVDALAARPGDERSAEDIRAGVQAMVDLVPRLAPATAMFAEDAHQADPALAASVWGARMAANLREYAGLLGSLFTPALTRGQPFTQAERAQINQVKGRIDQLRHMLDLRVESSQATPEIVAAHSAVQQRYFAHAAQLLAEVERVGLGDGRFGLSPAEFAERYVPDMDAIVTLRDVQLQDAVRLGTEARERSREALLGLAALTAALLALVLAMLYLIRQRVVLPLTEAAHVLDAMGRGQTGEISRLPAQTSDEIAAIFGGIESLRRQSQARAELELERDKLIDTLREQSTTDFLTGLPNRRAFFEAAEAELARARRHGFSVVLLLMDVDHFKRVNDTFGHLVGDQALVAVARVLQQGMRQGDLVARVGGEELVALLSHCSLEAGVAFAERLREAIHARPIEVGGGRPPLHVSVSIGVADSDAHGHGLDQLVARADEAMYRAKHGGRNRTAWAETAN